jgi:hypothetical protein
MNEKNAISLRHKSRIFASRLVRRSYKASDLR